MGRDNHPRARHAKKLERKKGKKPIADRVLIVSEGTVTEINYFEEIRVSLRLQTAKIRCVPANGTTPLQVVDTALDIFLNGDPHKGIPAKSFEKVFAVFDRDDHLGFLDAINRARSINSKKYKNDESRAVKFKSVVSIPSFELWLLLHFEDCFAQIHRDDVEARLGRYFVNGYEKNMGTHFQSTKNLINEAFRRAAILKGLQADDLQYNPSTEVAELVESLLHLKGP